MYATAAIKLADKAKPWTKIHANVNVSAVAAKAENVLILMAAAQRAPAPAAAAQSQAYPVAAVLFGPAAVRQHILKNLPAKLAAMAAHKQEIVRLPAQAEPATHGVRVPAIKPHALHLARREKNVIPL